VCIFHSATLTYFSQDERRRFAELVTSLAGRRNVFWVWLEDPRVMDKVVGPSAGLANLAEPLGQGFWASSDSREVTGRNTDWVEGLSTVDGWNGWRATSREIRAGNGTRIGFVTRHEPACFLVRPSRRNLRVTLRTLRPAVTCFSTFSGLVAPLVFVSLMSGPGTRILAPAAGSKGVRIGSFPSMG